MSSGYFLTRQRFGRLIICFRLREALHSLGLFGVNVLRVKTNRARPTNHTWTVHRSFNALLYILVQSAFTTLFYLWWRSDNRSLTLGLNKSVQLINSYLPPTLDTLVLGRSRSSSRRRTFMYVKYLHLSNSITVH